MSEREALAEVLRAHEYVPLDAFDWRCICGWRELLKHATLTPRNFTDAEIAALDGGA